MDFPDFGNNEDVHVEDNVNGEGANNTGYQVFGMEGGGFDMDAGNWNNQPQEMLNNPSTTTNTATYDPFGAHQIDEEEENRQRQRKAEEEERRAKLMQRMNEEISVKQEIRDKARNYLEDWKE
jgi:hypothetical protein